MTDGMQTRQWVATWTRFPRPDPDEIISYLVLLNGVTQCRLALSPRTAEQTEHALPDGYQLVPEH